MMQDLTLRVRSPVLRDRSGTRLSTSQKRRRAPEPLHGDPLRGEARQSRAGYLDMLSKALREYDTVSVEPSTDGPRAVLFENGASRAGIDVRRFPWIRPLSGDYAYNFRSRRVAVRRRPDSDRRRGATSSGGSRHQTPATGARSPDVHRGAAGAPRRAARGTGRRRAARGSRRPSPSSPASRPGRSADRCTPAQGGHRDPARPARRRASTHVPVVPIFWVDAEDHDWERDRRVYGARRRRSSRGPSRWRRRRAPASCRSRRLTLDERRRAETIDELAAVLPPTAFTESAPRQPARRPIGPASAWPRRSPAGSSRRSGASGWWSSNRPIRRPSRSRAGVSRASCATPGAPPRWRPRRARRCRALGHAPQVEPQPDQPSLFHLDGARTRHPAQRRRVRRSATTTIPARTLVEQAERSPAQLQPQRAAAADRAGHALPDDLLRGRSERDGVPRPAAAASTRSSAFRCR